MQDVDSSHKFLSDHLRSNGDLKSLPDIVRELELKAQQQVVVLKDAVIKKDDVLKETSRQNWNLTNKVDYVTSQREEAEREMQKLNELHKKGKMVYCLLWIRAYILVMMSNYEGECLQCL